MSAASDLGRPSLKSAFQTIQRRMVQLLEYASVVVPSIREYPHLTPELADSVVVLVVARLEAFFNDLVSLGTRHREDTLRSIVGLDEFSDTELMSVGAGFTMTSDASGIPTVPRTPVQSILVPMAGGFPEGHSYAMAPIDGLYPSEFALHYLMLFMLASVVRYRPDTWAHAISRSVLSNRPADDEVLAILERFLEVHLSSIVGLVVPALNPNEDRYR